VYVCRHVGATVQFNRSNGSAATAENGIVANALFVKLFRNNQIVNGE
jgi:hypothetical protein